MSTTNTLPKFDLADLEVDFSVTREQFHFPKESGIPVYLMFKQEIVEDKTGIGERIRTRRVRQADGTLAPSATAAGAPANNEDTVYTSVVIDLQTGEECSIIVHRLLLKALTDRYTGTEYIDKILMVIRNSAKSGRGEYHTFVVKQMKLKQQEQQKQPNGAPAQQQQAPAAQQRRK